MKRSALKLLLVLVLLINSISIGAVAQNSPRHVLFDGNPTEVATVHTNGQTFVVYEYDNLLPYASGIEVYSGGKRVTSAESVDEVFRALARRRATKFEPESRSTERLRRVVDQSQSIQVATSDAIKTLNETLSYRQTLKEKSVNNTSAWEVAIEESNALDESFASGFSGPSDAGELRNQLMAVRASARGLETNASRVISLLQKQQAGREINQTNLYRRYAGFYRDLETLQSQMASIHPSMAETANMSRTVASQARSVPTVGEEIQQQFATLGTALDLTHGKLAGTGPSLTELRTALPQVATDEAFQTQLTKRWKQRQGVVMKIYATLAEGGILLIALVFALLETRDNLQVQ